MIGRRQAAAAAVAAILVSGAQVHAEVPSFAERSKSVYRLLPGVRRALGPSISAATVWTVVRSGGTGARAQ
jgi:hypothetical protein